MIPVLSTLNDYEFTEVFIERDKNTLLLVSQVQNFVVTWILTPVTGPDHIATGCFELLDRSTPDASV